MTPPPHHLLDRRPQKLVSRLTSFAVPSGIRCGHRNLCPRAQVSCQIHVATYPARESPQSLTCPETPGPPVWPGAGKGCGKIATTYGPGEVDSGLFLVLPAFCGKNTHPAHESFQRFIHPETPLKPPATENDNSGYHFLTPPGAKTISQLMVFSPSPLHSPPPGRIL